MIQGESTARKHQGRLSRLLSALLPVSEQSGAIAQGRQLPVWQFQIIDSLVQGTSVDDAIRRGLAGGKVSGDLATEFAQAVQRSPAFWVARSYWMRLRCRDWLLRVQATLSEHGADGARLDMRSGVSREEFERNYYFSNRALLLRGIASGWPAVKLWNQEYLAHACGDVTVEVMIDRMSAEVTMRNTAADLARSIALRDYLALMFGTDRSNDFYLVSRNRFFEQPGTRVLLDDVGDLPFVNTRAPGAGVKMWLGPAGTVTELHHDDRNNFIVQIFGRKRVRVYPPYYAELMAQSQAWYAGADPAKDPAGDKGSAGQSTFVLEPGDGLFIPVGWWHALEALDPSSTLAFIDFSLPNEYGRPY